MSFFLGVLDDPGTCREYMNVGNAKSLETRVGETPPTTGVIVVTESRGSRNFLWGFLTVAFASTFVAINVLAETTGGRVAGGALFGLLLIGSVAAWVWSVRNPGRLEITPDEIVFTHGHRSRGRRLPHTGDLYVHVTYPSGHPLRWLRVTGSDDGFPITLFDVEEIERACVAAGWRFAEEPS